MQQAQARDGRAGMTTAETTYRHGQSDCESPHVPHTGWHPAHDGRGTPQNAAGAQDKEAVEDAHWVEVSVTVDAHGKLICLGPEKGIYDFDDLLLGPRSLGRCPPVLFDREFAVSCGERESKEAVGLLVSDENSDVGFHRILSVHECDPKIIKEMNVSEPLSPMAQRRYEPHSPTSFSIISC